MTLRLPLLALCALLCFTSVAAEKWATPDEVDATTAALKEFFLGAEVRYPGSPGNLAMEKKVAEIFGGSGFEHGEIRFETATMTPGKASLQAAGLAQMRMFTLHPTVARPGNFAQKQLQTNLVYLGRGGVDDLEAVKGIDLRGVVAVMDFDGADDWTRLLRFGITGIIFCGAERYEYTDAVAKIYNSESAYPRYFVSAEDGVKLKAALTDDGNGKPVRKSIGVTIEAEPSRVQNTSLRDLWVFIPGSDTALNKEVCVITAPIDSNCIVPDLAEGAQSGANLFLLVKLLQSFTKEPPARSLLLVAMNSHTAGWQGERMLAWHLLSPQRDVEDVRNLLVQDIRLQEMYQKHYSELLKLVDDPARKVEAENRLVELRELTDSSSGKQMSVKEKLVTRVRGDVNKSKTAQMDQYRDLRKQGATEEDARKGVLSLEAGRKKYINVLKLFNKWGHSTVLSDLNDEERTLLRGYIADALEENSRAAELNHRDLDRDEQNNGVRNVLQGRSVKSVFCMDLNFQNRKLGFWSGEFWSNKEWRRAYGAKVVELSKDLKAVQEGRDNLLVDTMTFGGGLPEGHYFPGTEGVAFIQTANGTPALSLQNCFSQFGRLFTPGDNFQSLDKEIVAEASNYVPALFRAMFAADMATLKTSDIRQPNWTILIRTLRFDEFSASVVPDVPVPKTLLTLQPRDHVPVNGDVVKSLVALTDMRSMALFYGCRENYIAMNSTGMQFDDDFVKVLHTIDGGEKEVSLTSNVVRRAMQTVVMFPCTEFQILHREDPSMIGSGEVRTKIFLPLDSKRETMPRQLGLAGVGSTFSSKKFLPTLAGPASVFTDGKQRVKFLTDNKLPVLKTSPEYPEGEGFASPKELPTDFIAAAAEDIRTMNRYRLGRLHGISQELADQYLQQCETELKATAAADKAHDHTAYVQSSYKALGAGKQAYLQVMGITNDMLRAVIFYMALILPFCFFMQRLLFDLVKIEAQIGAFCGLFLISYLGFRNIHPAFEVAKSPEGILIAFIMLSLGVFVIKILHGRFEGEMQLLFRNYAGDISEVGYSTVGQKAMLIGVNNMRRRRVRTALTTATIVLVTFTMLSFTSISSTVSPTIVAVSRNAPAYTGFMYHLPAKRMDESIMRVMREIFQGKADVVVRRWLTPAVLEKSAIPMRVDASTGKTAQVEGVLGLSKLDDGLLGPMPIAAGKYFSRDDADEVVLPTSIAEALGVTATNFEGSTIKFQGRDLKVVGLLDDQKFRMLSDLDGLLLLPQKESLAQGSGSGEVVAGGTTGMQVQGADQTGFYVEASVMILLPVETSLKFGAQTYSVSMRFHDDTKLWPEVLDLLKITGGTAAGSAKFYIGSRAPFIAGVDDPKAAATPAAQQQKGPEMNAGVYYVGSGFKTSLGNLSSLIIPLLISGTIILNTMLGSVYERKKEIAIYNAVGLNPSHIGMFFLSEAFVYSIIGSVGGYMIGQLLSIGLIQLGVSGIDLNFSSLKVVYVILFTIGMVLLSTLYPAIVATRSAVPSGKRKWEIPVNDGHTMSLVFPFIYQPNVVRGIMGYLEEYFARFTEASVGDLIATLEQRTRLMDPDDREILTLQYNVALAPFDLGVTQRVTLVCAFDHRVQAYRITLTSVRLSGQDTNWVTTNKPFLERLRTYLMHWRNMTAEQQAIYAQAGGEPGLVEAGEDDVTTATVVLPG